MAANFVFLTLPRTHFLDLAGPNQVILEAMGFGADFEMSYCSIDKPLETSSGFPMGKLPHFSKMKMKAGDFLIIPGAETSYLTSDEFTNEKQLIEWIKTQHKNGVNICSICVGAFVLGHCGLLGGIKCTTHFKKTKDLQKLFRAADVIENILYTEQNGIYTSAGIVSGIDMMLSIVEDLKGSYFAHLVARELVVYNRRNGNQKQQSDLLEFRNHVHAGIHKVQDWLQENLYKKYKQHQLAEIANMSERNFTRIFKKETGITVNAYITILRKERIRELIKNPDISRMQIAQKCGLKSTRQLSRIISVN